MNAFVLLLAGNVRLQFKSLESTPRVFQATTTKYSMLAHYHGHQSFLLETPFQLSIIDIKAKQRIPLALQLSSPCLKNYPNLAFKYIVYSRIKNRDVIFSVGHASITGKPDISLAILMIAYLDGLDIRPAHIFLLYHFRKDIEDNFYGAGVFTDAGLCFGIRNIERFSLLKMECIEQIAQGQEVQQMDRYLINIRLKAGVLSITSCKSSHPVSLFLSLNNGQIVKFSANTSSNTLADRQGEPFSITQEIMLDMVDTVMLFEVGNDVLLVYGYHTNSHSNRTIRINSSLEGNTVADVIIQNIQNSFVLSWIKVRAEIVAICANNTILTCVYSTGDETRKRRKHQASLAWRVGVRKRPQIVHARKPPIDTFPRSNLQHPASTSVSSPDNVPVAPASHQPSRSPILPRTRSPPRLETMMEEPETETQADNLRRDVGRKSPKFLSQFGSCRVT